LVQSPAPKEREGGGGGGGGGGVGEVGGGRDEDAEEKKEEIHVLPYLIQTQKDVWCAFGHPNFQNPIIWKSSSGISEFHCPSVSVGYHLTLSVMADTQWFDLSVNNSDRQAELYFLFIWQRW
jgi:hypothetical protein